MHRHLRPAVCRSAQPGAARQSAAWTCRSRGVRAARHHACRSHEAPRDKGKTMYTDVDRAQAIHAESKRLEAFLSALSPQDWQRPSQCDQWQVADVVAHLIEDKHAERLTRGLQGDLTPAGFVPLTTLSADDLREYIAQHPIALRRQLGDQLLATFGAENDQVGLRTAEP